MPFGLPRNDKIMTHSLSITYGSTTITLALVDYTPTSALASVAEVTERWEVHVTGASKALLQAAIHEIERAFELARQHQANSFLDRVFLNFQPGGYEESYRSQILDGKIDFYDETLKWAWANAGFDVRLTITRRNFWEGAEAEIPLSNSNGERVIEDLLWVYNCADGDGVSPNVRENWADIDADDLEGDLPAPIKLTMVTSGTIGDIIEDVIVCLARSGDPATLKHMAEAEAGGGKSSGSKIVDFGDDPDCSGGEYAIIEWDEVSVPVIGIGYYSGTGWPDLEIGRWYLPLLRLRTVPTIADLWTRVRMVYGLISETAWISYPASGGPQVIQYPPIRLGLPRWEAGDYDVDVEFLTSTGGTKTIEADYMYLLPLDGARQYEASLEALYEEPYMGAVYDDPYEGLVYKYENHTTTRSLVLARGNPLLVDPRHDARLYFMTPGATAAIDSRMDFNAFYRPRRLAL